MNFAGVGTQIVPSFFILRPVAKLIVILFLFCELLLGRLCLYSAERSQIMLLRKGDR